MNSAFTTRVGFRFTDEFITLFPFRLVQIDSLWFFVIFLRSQYQFSLKIGTVERLQIYSELL